MIHRKKFLVENMLEYLEDPKPLSRRAFLSVLTLSALELNLPSASYSRIIYEKDLEDMVTLIRKNEHIRRIIDQNPKETPSGVKIQSEWMYSLVALESSFNPYAVSEDGAKGLWQLTEKAVIEQKGSPNIYNSQKIFDPRINHEIGSGLFAKYLDYFVKGAEKRDKELIRESIPSFAERFKFTLAGYNTGPFRVIDRIIEFSNETNSPYINFHDIESQLHYETRCFVHNNLSLLERLGAYSHRDNKLLG